MEQTLEIFGMPENWDEVAKFYLEAFEDMPIDLVEKALKEVRRNLKWFPKPSELRKPVADDLARRKMALNKLEMMK